MKRIGVAALALAALSSSSLAQEWRPFGDLPGFVVRSPRYVAPPPRGVAARNDGSVFGGSVFGGGSGGQKFPPIMSGGGQPSIAPSAPPTVNFPNGYGNGTIVIDTAGRALYYVLSSNSAYRYPISVGREGFTWTGTERISRVADWPEWRPPAEMRQRDPNLPELMYGGVNNPLGAKALYLGNSLYRIHGTNDSRTIGYAASSGCFRMMNAHVIHLSMLAGVGTKVMVMNSLPGANRRFADTPARRS
jgi:lipoprotein-anchoring transpeptidase ErfK/SrfK